MNGNKHAVSESWILRSTKTNMNGNKHAASES